MFRMGNPFKLVHVLALIGTIPVLYVVERSIDFALFHFTTPTKPLQKYRRPYPKPTYALIAGGNGGIGYGIALALVKNGFGVILLGRNSVKLDAAAEKLREALVLPSSDDAHRDEYVKTIVLDPQTATPGEIEKSVRETIVEKRLRVSILVGSAPVAYPPYRVLSSYSPEDIDRTIDLNARFMAHLTTRMIPILGQVHKDSSTGADQRGRSLILNMSSGGKIGLPYQAMYASTKGFTSSFSMSLSRELKEDPSSSNIDVLAIAAGDVKSQGNVAGLAKGSPDSEDYGRYIVERSDGAIRRGLKEMTPYWPHHLNIILLNVTPERFVDQGILDVMLKKLNAANGATKPKDA